MAEQKSPTRLSKQEIAIALLGLGYTEEQLVDSDGNKLKRPELLEKLQEHQRGLEALDCLDDVDDENDVGIAVLPDTKGDVEPSDDILDTPEKIILTADCLEEPIQSEPELMEPPTPNDPEWTQYVLGQFMDDEIDGKNPRVEGLRRVAGQLVGELIEEGCDLLAVPTEENRFRACAKAWGVFQTPNGQVKRFEALADAHGDNCFEDYATYLVAMADTRAKGRVFRNALCLRRVVSSEEVRKTMAAAEDTQNGGDIHTSQISLIRLVADRNNFSISEVLDSLGIAYELNARTGSVELAKLSYDDALATAKKMREMKEEKETKNG